MRSYAVELVDALACFGLERAYGVAGGASMYLNAALATDERISTKFLHHEQAAAIAATADAMVSGYPAVLFVTNGPGVVNALTGVAAAWLDSVPMFVISGEARSDHLGVGSGLRNLGIQALPIEQMVSSIVKQFKCLSSGDDPRLTVANLLKTSVQGRPGPVWLQVPLDVQSASAEGFVGLRSAPDSLSFKLETVADGDSSSSKALSDLLIQIEHALLRSRRPVIWIGEGSRRSLRNGKLRRLLETLSAPVVTSWRMKDCAQWLPDGGFGCPGIVSDGFANCLIESADLLFVLGSRCDFTQLGFDATKVASSAFKIVVDIDEHEVRKLDHWADLSVTANIESVVQDLFIGSPAPSFSKWREKCEALRSLTSERDSGLHVDQYSRPETSSGVLRVRELASEVSSQLSDAVLVVGSAGSAIEIFLQNVNIESKTRLIFSTGLGSMGFALPSAVGALCSSEGKEVLCVESDGSMMFNIQELATLISLSRPILIVVLDNDGYASIANSQRAWFGWTVCGSSKSDGLPPFAIDEIAIGFGWEVRHFGCLEEFRELVVDWRRNPRPLMVIARVDPMEDRLPRIPSHMNSQGVMEQASYTDFVGWQSAVEVEDLVEALKSYGKNV